MSKNYAHIIQYFNSHPWAILPEKLHAMIGLIELRAAGVTLTDNEIEARISQPSRTKPQTSAPGSIAVLPITGTISHRAGLLRRSSGGSTTEQISAELDAAIRDPDIAAIVLDIDSPGGSTAGIEELADEIYSARGEKRIVAGVNSLAASAAYWLASQAHEIAVTPSGYVGSIGVLGVHMDFSEQARQQGVAVTLVSSGKYKAETSEFKPLTTGARKHLQAMADERHGVFVSNVARGRGVSEKTVRSGFGQGRLVTAKDAISEGMADKLEPFRETIQRLAGTKREAVRLTAEAETRLVSLELAALEPEHKAIAPEFDPAIALQELEQLEK